MDNLADWILKTHKCCACGLPLRDVPSTGINMVQLEYYTTWKYPNFGNVLQGTSGIAGAVVCDPCQKNGAKILSALEYRPLEGGEKDIFYHPVSELTPVEPQ